MGILNLFVILIKSERPNHKYILKYKSKSGKWVYVYKVGSSKTKKTKTPKEKLYHDKFGIDVNMN